MMAGKGRSTQKDWDPMRDDFNDSFYDPQYPDEESSETVQLDPCRLYIRNIPKTLQEEGLRTVCSKYGTLTEVYISRDPVKRFGLVSYETPGEAKLAITKLNRMEPLQLQISIAHLKPRKGNQPQPYKQREHKSFTPKDNPQYSREETASGSSRGRYSSRRQQDEAMQANGESEMDDFNQNDDGLDSMDPDLNLELEQLKLEQLKLQEAQLVCKHRILLKKAEKKASVQSSATNRRVLPDGKILVCNVENSTDRDGDSSFANGGGDSRVSSRACVSCASPADQFCARCGVTPYCGEICQRKDWWKRHKTVCHNLARLNDAASQAKGAEDIVDSSASATPPIAPLRRPRSPAATKFQREPKRDDDNDRYNKKFVPPGSAVSPRSKQDTRGASTRFNKFQKKEHSNDNKDEDWGSPKPSTSKAHEVKDVPYKKNVMNNSETPEKSAPKVDAPVPKAKEPVARAEVPVTKAKVPVAVEKTAKKLVPESYMVENLSIGDTCMLAVQNTAADCKHESSAGFVCLSLHEKYSTMYGMLCEDYLADCEKAKDVEPSPGDTISYLNPADGAWYRARCLSPKQLAFLDGSEVVALGNKCRELAPKYRDIPEFCCVLIADSVQIGNSLSCTLLSKTTSGYKVSIVNGETGASVGEGEITRWLPAVEITATPQATSAAPQVTSAAPQVTSATPAGTSATPAGTSATPAATASSSAPPEVPRPELKHNSKVFLVEVSGVDKMFVRPADEQSQVKYDGILHDVVFYGASASPLKVAPKQGDTVIGKFEDLHYRALCKRTSVKNNKYMLEFTDFGNTTISPLEDVYPCPASLDLESRPVLVSQIQLQGCKESLTPEATAYLEKLKEDNMELLLSLPSGQTAGSGSEVRLTVTKNNESVNNKVETFCTPEWKKLEQKGADVVGLSSIMFHDMKYLDLPEKECELEILDFGTIQEGTVCGCERGNPHLQYVLTTLTEKMGEYCNSALGKEPYLPKVEELCIAQCPPFPQWFRAVMCEQESGAGGDMAQVLYIDYGNVDKVPVSCLRKMLPEFVTNLPALANTIEIIDFPKNASVEILRKALEHMNVNDEGRGVLKVAKCYKTKEAGTYRVEAPELLAAIQ